MLFMEATTDTMKTFTDAIVQAVTTNVSLGDVALVVGGIISAGIVAMFAWKFARKGFAFVKNALSGKAGKV